MSTPKRVFLVGCPRSGTTLLQTIVGSHPDVFTFPETHYFRKIRGRLGPSGRMVSPRAAARALDDLLETVGWQRPRPRIPRMWPLVGAYGRVFPRVVDFATGEHGKTVWVEKSPLHLRYIEEISYYVPDAHFLHILRDGRDVVASLYALCQNEPDRWIPQLLPVRPRHLERLPSRESIIDAAVDRWNRDVVMSLSYRDNPSHLLVFYEDVVEDLPAAVAELCAFLGVDEQPAMLRPWEAAEAVAGWRGGLEHMGAIFQPPRHQPRRLFAALSEETQQRVVERLRFGGDPRGDTQPPGAD